MLQSGDEAIVDPEWKERRNAKVGDTVVLFERPFRIVGVYEPPGGGRIKIPLKTMQDQEGTDNKASAILVACVDPAKQDEVAAKTAEASRESYQKVLTGSGHGTITTTYPEFGGHTFGPGHWAQYTVSRNAPPSADPTARRGRSPATVASR